MICFRCGHLVHKEDRCPFFTPNRQQEGQSNGDHNEVQYDRLVKNLQDGGHDKQTKYAAWMLV